jgi:GTPase
MPNIVAIVGRPNVGKSTFFNRLVEQRKAIVDNVSGVTRDRHYGFAEWTGHHFTVMDTGGYVADSDDLFESAIRNQVELAIEEASVILFLVDAAVGLTDLDKSFANKLRGNRKPVIVVANKADNQERLFAANEFYELGMGTIFPVAAISGSGTGDLLDEVVKHFQHEDVENPEENVPRLAILGKPNVGKSSFLNLLLGKERSIVTSIAGTTRDTINNRYKLFGKDFILTDTAGLRKKSRVTDDVEFYSTLRSVRAMESSDVCIIMVDAQTGIESQDMNIIALAVKNRKGLVILANKWDLIEKDSSTAAQVRKAMQAKLGPLQYIPILFTSMVSKQRVFQAIEEAGEVYKRMYQRISTSKLNDAMLEVINKYPPPAVRGKHIRIKYLTQLPPVPPTFAFFSNHPKLIKEPYTRYLENRMREIFDLSGVPIRILYKQK